MLLSPVQALVLVVVPFSCPLMLVFPGRGGGKKKREEEAAKEICSLRPHQTIEAAGQRPDLVISRVKFLLCKSLSAGRLVVVGYFTSGRRRPPRLLCEEEAGVGMGPSVCVLTTPPVRAPGPKTVAGS